MLGGWLNLEFSQGENISSNKLLYMQNILKLMFAKCQQENRGCMNILSDNISAI